jgi:hypothetical protein
VTIDEAKAVLLAGCDDADLHHPGETPPGFREAIAALPDRARLLQLDPLLRALIETRLHQLVTVEVVS